MTKRKIKTYGMKNLLQHNKKNSEKARERKKKQNHIH